VSAEEFHERAPGAGAQTGATPSDEELRAAYEEELSRITSTELMLQSAVSLLNLGGRRLGPPGGAAPGEGAPRPGARDLEQVRDAIDGVRALLGVLERRLSKELGPLRDALSQLQLAYAREAQASTTPQPSEDAEPGKGPEQPPASAEKGAAAGENQSRGPGPAEASGRLWVPDR
jgi:hypothetical protein